MKRLLPPTFWMICLALMLLLKMVWPLATLLSFPLSLVGLIPLLFGFWVMMAAWSNFRKQNMTIDTFGTPVGLIRGGLYHYSRNPMYLGFAVMLVGVWLLLGGLTPLIGVIVFIMVVDRWYIAFEEKSMQAQFGAAYQDYQSEVRRWI